MKCASGTCGAGGAGVCAEDGILAGGADGDGAVTWGLKRFVTRRRGDAERIQGVKRNPAYSCGAPEDFLSLRLWVRTELAPHLHAGLPINRHRHHLFSWGDGGVWGRGGGGHDGAGAFDGLPDDLVELFGRVRSATVKSILLLCSMTGRASGADLRVAIGRRIFLGDDCGIGAMAWKGSALLGELSQAITGEATASY